MAIYDLFSKRQTDGAISGTADVYLYDNIPSNVRVQVKQIALEGVGLVGTHGDGLIRGHAQNGIWVQIEQVFLREKGLETISRDFFAGDRVLEYMQGCATNEWLDFLELIALGIGMMSEDKLRHEREQWRVTTTAEDAIDEINYRLRQARVGYQIEGAQLIRIDSQFIHAEIVRPALALLSGHNFEGPRQEFLCAHQHYRAGEHRQAVAMAANAVESTFKSIFDQKGWVYPNGARISDLAKVARANDLWPAHMSASFDQLLATLQSGLAKIRDSDASHGQGAQTKEVPAYVAAYALHLAASKILFISEAAK